MKRLFAAIKIQPGEAFLARYWALRNSLKNENIKWVDPGNFHLTLKFFGETPEHHIPGINVALQQAANHIAPFDYNLVSIGIFGSSYNPRLIWIGIEDKGEIKSLAGNVFKELENIGIEQDSQNFVPHLSFGRIKFLEDKKLFHQVIDKHREGPIQKEEVSNFHLFESILGRDGPRYTVLKSFELKG